LRRILALLGIPAATTAVEIAIIVGQIVAYLWLDDHDDEEDLE